MAIGAGGSKIISSVAYVSTRALFFGETLKEAVDARRLHNQLSPYLTDYEVGFPDVRRKAIEVSMIVLIPKTVSNVVHFLERGIVMLRV